MLRLHFGRFVIALLFVCLLASPSGSNANANPRPPKAVEPARQPVDTYPAVIPDDFQIKSITPSGMVLELHAPSYSLETTINQGYTCQNLVAEGYYPDSPSGEPATVSRGILLGIPLGSPPTMTIKSLQTVDYPQKVNLCPVPALQVQPDQSGLAVNEEEVLSQNTQVYSIDSFLPVQPVELAIRGMIRSQRVACMIFTPFLYNPSRDELRLVQNVVVEIQFGQASFDQALPVLVDEGPFESVLRNTLINYDQARLWRSPHSTNTLDSGGPSATQLQSQLQYKIAVDQNGIYQVTYEDLQTAGVPVVEVVPQTLRLFNQDSEVPIYVMGEEDGSFDPGDYFLFYGQKINTKYSRTNLYWLSWGNGNGLRMAIQDGSVNDASYTSSFTTTLHLEEDQRYINTTPSGPQNDHWYWYILNGTSTSTPVSHDFTFLLENPASGASSTLRGLLKGYFANPQHHTLISLNNHLLDDHTWPSTAEYLFSIEISPEDLVTGVNTITVECPLDNGITRDQVLVNWFELDYSHTFTAENDQLDFRWDQPGTWQFDVSGFITSTIDVFDITDPAAPERILESTIRPGGPPYQVIFERPVVSSSRYLAISSSRWLSPLSITPDIPSNYKNPSNGADYIIISPGYFLDAIQPLATYRASQGLRVKVVDVQDVYDEFNGGVLDSRAIRDFLAYVYSSWTAPAPSYVLLVGDGHYDFLDNYGDSGPEYVPPYLGEFDPWIGETAADNRYVTVSGDDILPDMSIGRLPANSAEEAAAMVEKILAYDRYLVRGHWNTRLTFVTDNADAAGNFPALSDSIVDNYLPAAYSVDKIYYGTEPYTNTLATRAAVINSINQGSLLVNFVGHGSVQFWAAENLFRVNSIPSLANLDMYPFFVPLTCAEGYFIYPPAVGHNYPSLAESLVRTSGKGAIASFSPSGFGLSIGHDLLAQGLYRAFFTDDLLQFGPATTYAKYYLSGHSIGYDDLIDTYNLLGDPASQLKIPPAYTISLPLINH